MAHEILDDNTQKSFVPTLPRRIAWYIKHAAMVIALHIIVLVIVLFVLPNIPKVIEEYVSMATLAIMMLGMYGITLYTYVKGFEWNIVAGLIGGSFSFFFCFVYTMTYLENLQLYYQQHFASWFPLPASMEKDALDLLIVGIAYSFLVIPCTEIMALLGWIFRKIMSYK